MIKAVLQAKPRDLEFDLIWFLIKPIEEKARFSGSILTALLTDPAISSTWKIVRRKIKTQSHNHKLSLVSDRHGESFAHRRWHPFAHRRWHPFAHRRWHPYYPAMRHPGSSRRSKNIGSNTNSLTELLSSINIYQYDVSGDGYCMWHALSYGLNQSGVAANISAHELQQTLSQFIGENNYAPELWGTSDHLDLAAQYFNVHIIELLQTGASQLSGTLFQPLATGSVLQVPVLETGDVLNALQGLHTQGQPFIIMINNTPINTSGSLELDYTNHWSAGIWMPSASLPTSLPSFLVDEAPALWMNWAQFTLQY